jgi:MFS family permease
MMAVAVLTYLPTVGADYSLAGLASGCVGLGSALGAPLFGRLVDAHGPRRLLGAFAAFQALAFTAFLLAAPTLVETVSAANASAGAHPAPGSMATLLGLAALIGASCPQVGAVARVVWRRKFGTDSRMTTAMSFESTMDELSFVIGPVLVGLLASTVGGSAPLVFSAVAVVVAVGLFIRAIPAISAEDSTSEPVPLTGLRLAMIAVCALGMISMGTIFGGTLTALLPYATVHGIPGTTGLLYGAMSLTSAIFALTMSFWAARVPPVLRWVLIGVALTLAASLLPHASSVPVMVAALLLLGVPVGPSMVTIFETAGRVTPSPVLATVMTIMGSGIVTGTALASAIAGSVAEQSGYQGAFVVAIAGGAGVLVTGCVQALLTRADRNARA